MYLNLYPFALIICSRYFSTIYSSRKVSSTTSPALYTSNKGQSATVLLALSAGDTVNLINSTINDLHFQNNVDGTYTINGGIGSLAAWITLHAI